MHYNQNPKELEQTLKNFYRHLKKGGLLIFDMGFNEERWKEGFVNVGNWSNKKVDLVRFSRSRRQEILEFYAWHTFCSKIKNFILEKKNTN